jgi:hypothetical protein
VNQRIFEELARQRQADIRRRAAGHAYSSTAAGMRAGAALASTATHSRRPAGSARVSASPRHTRDASRSLRARAGWWLVGLGLKLAVGPHSRAAASPRPAGSRC